MFLIHPPTVRRRRFAVACLTLALGLVPPAAAPASAQAAVPLAGPWRFHAGDDPRWAAPDLDDRAWRTVPVPGRWERAMPGYDGYGWYRRAVALPAGLDEPIGLRLGKVGNAVEVFWNGVSLGRRGAFPPEAVGSEAAVMFLVPSRALEAARGGEHLLAVRVYNEYGAGGLIGAPEVGRYDVLARRGARGELLIGGLIAFFLAAGIYHLAFFFRRSKGRDNLYFALLCACAALYGATFSPSFDGMVAGAASPYRLRLLALVAAAPAYGGLLVRMFDLAIGRVSRAAALLFLGLLPVVTLLPLGVLAALRPAISVLIGLGLAVGLVRVWASASRRGPYRRILTVGVTALTLAMSWDLLCTHALVPSIHLVDRVPGLFWAGFLAFVLGVGAATAGNFAEAEVNARTDGLTGLVRRHVFVDALAREAERRRRAGGMLTLLIIDLDRFKQINDGYGHRAGDEVLARVGHLLRHNARNIDLTSRLGGEEFGVLLSDTDADGAISFIERFRQRLSELQVPAGDDVISGLTASVGIAVSTGWVDTDALLDAADDAMYRAKKAGRDRVVTVNLPLDWPGRPSSIPSAE